MSEDVRSYNVGASDYSKHRIQPWQIWTEYELDPFRADIIKRILRTKKEPNMSLRDAKIQDLKKIEHIIKYMIELYDSDNFPWDKKDAERTPE